MNDDFLIGMGKRICLRRKELGFTQEQVAEKVNLSLQSISCIELGKKAIRPENLAKLCGVLDVSADYILFGRRTEKQLEEIDKLIARLSVGDMKLLTSIAERLNIKN